MDNPYIKLFLSVDIAGSTKLKNTNNYLQIQNFCEEYTNIERKLNSKEVHNVEEIYKHICDNEAHQDWSVIIEKCLGDFHQNFNARLNKKADPKFKEQLPWKMAGDELIYCMNVPTRKDVYDYLYIFFITLRYFDKQYAEKNSDIRLKGAAWTAGFPIRNRRITPVKYLGPDKEKKTKLDDEQAQEMLPLEDYMGPEIDIGFRIGKHTFPGIIVVSLELAYILNDPKLEILDTKRLRVIDTGWEELKGVWDGNKYPIYWLDLPEECYSEAASYDKDLESIKYTPYKQWEIEKDAHVAKYEKHHDEEDYVTQEDLDKIIDSLPDPFDVIRPYFIEEDMTLPPAHQKRADFIKKVEVYNKKKDDQTTTPVPKVPAKQEPAKTPSQAPEYTFADAVIDVAAGVLKTYLKSLKK